MHGTLEGRRPSSVIWYHRAAVFVATFVLSSTAASPLSAQDSTSADSVLARLERAEEQISLLRQQLETQAGSGVQTRSGARVELWGRVIANAWRNTGLVNNLDVPTVALVPVGRPLPTVGGVFRQSTIGLNLSNVQALGGQASASLSGDFYGGVQSGSGNRRLFPEPRLRIASAAVRWKLGEIMIGQEVPLIASEEPVSLASIGIPDFASAGNLWFWLPQLRFLIETSSRVRFGLQGAIIAPWSGEDPSTSGNVDIAESSDRPYLQSRLRATWGDPARPGELGVGAHVGWLRRSGTADIEQGSAVSLTGRIPVGWLELRGEIYRGSLLRGLGGGGISQNFGAPATPGGLGAIILDTGGWAQLNITPSPAVLLGGGCGIDDPRDSDLPVRSHNRACEGHLHLRPSGPVVIGLEFRALRTEYLPSRAIARNNHFNLALGVEF
jgi:hypothetical protein